MLSDAFLCGFDLIDIEYPDKIRCFEKFLILYTPSGMCFIPRWCCMIFFGEHLNENET